MANQRHPSPERIWTLAYQKLLALDQTWDTAKLLRTKMWMSNCGIPRLEKLANLLSPTISRRDLWNILVPVEREIKRAKPTDVTILDQDPPPTSPTHRIPVTFVLDSLRSAMNVGGIFRVAECFALKELILTGYTPDPQSEFRVANSALGTEQTTPWRRFQTLQEAITHLHQEKVQIVAAETVVGGKSPTTFPWALPCAIVFGSERFGLTASDINLCDGTVYIPMFGAKNSLNVASASAILAYELRNQFPNIAR